jgi:hypothetical protein
VAYDLEARTSADYVVRTARGVGVIVDRHPLAPISPEQSAALRECWPNPLRIGVALRVARDAETCADLLSGLPVDPDRCDAAGLRWATDRLLVRLDLRAIDLLLAAS